MAEPRLGSVLVVDDEQDIRTMLSIVLSVEGWSVDDAAGGDDALEACTRRPYDVVVLDHRMPGLTGVQVAERLVAGGYPAKLLVFSAYVDSEIERQCEALGVAVVDKVDWYGLVDACREGAVRSTTDVGAPPPNLVAAPSST